MTSEDQYLLEYLNLDADAAALIERAEDAPLAEFGDHLEDAMDALRRLHELADAEVRQWHG